MSNYFCSQIGDAQLHAIDVHLFFSQMIDISCLVSLKPCWNTVSAQEKK